MPSPLLSPNCKPNPAEAALVAVHAKPVRKPDSEDPSAARTCATSHLTASERRLAPLIEGLDPILRLNAVLELTAQKQATWYRYMKLGLAPKSVKLGPNTVGWRRSDIKHWLESRPEA